MVLGTQYQKVDVEAKVPNCNILDGGGCLACKEDMQLQQKIQKLQERRRKLRTKMNADHDPFVLKLPPEVASRIFLLSMGYRDNDRVSCGDGLPTPFLLGAVCRGWRQLARSTPHLWPRLVFVISSKSKKSTIMESLPHLVADWLERSGGLPLTLNVSYRGSPDSTPKGSVSIIDALNRHSRRWHQVKFRLPSFYLGRLCGTSPPQNLCDISILSWWRTVRDPTFKMNTKPGPMKFTVAFVSLKAVDIAWDRLVHLEVNTTSLDGVLQVIRDAPLLEICSLSRISSPIDVPETIIRHPHLRTLKLSCMQTGAFTKFINSLELPSLESWALASEENVIAVDAISFLKRSGSGLKTLDLCQTQAPAFEDFERLLQAAPHLQRLIVDSAADDFSPMMDYILEKISASPPSALQKDNHAVFLSDLHCLTLRGQELNAWECIPLIYQWTHRKLLSLHIQMECIKIRDEISSILVQLADEGIDLGIFDLDYEDYLQHHCNPPKR